MSCERGNTWAMSAKQSRFFGSWFTNDCKEERRGWFCRAQRQPCCSSFFFLLYNISRLQPGGRRKWRCSGQADKQAFSMRATHTHTHTPTPDRSSRLGSVSRRLRLLLSHHPPLPRRTDRRRENASDETNASALFTCGRTSRRWQRPGVRAVWFYHAYLNFGWFTWRPRGSEVALVASCGRSTQPESTWREPVQTLRPSHLGRWS